MQTPYLHFVAELTRAFPTRPIILLEARHVSVCLSWRAFSTDAMADTAVEILQRWALSPRYLPAFSPTSIVKPSSGVSFSACRIVQDCWLADMELGYIGSCDVLLSFLDTPLFGYGLTCGGGCGCVQAWVQSGCVRGAQLRHICAESHYPAAPPHCAVHGAQCMLCMCVHIHAQVRFCRLLTCTICPRFCIAAVFVAGCCTVLDQTKVHFMWIGACRC